MSEWADDTIDDLAAKNAALKADNERLRDLLKVAEHAENDGFCEGASVCPWCNAEAKIRPDEVDPRPPHNPVWRGGHDNDCPAFNDDGSVK